MIIVTHEFATGARSRGICSSYKEYHVRGIVVNSDPN